MMAGAGAAALRASLHQALQALKKAPAQGAHGQECRDAASAQRPLRRLLEQRGQ
ncbi:unnamed protein product, partial [Symbiodinium microadriaticum]